VRGSREHRDPTAVGTLGRLGKSPAIGGDEIEQRVPVGEHLADLTVRGTV